MIISLHIHCYLCLKSCLDLDLSEFSVVISSIRNPSRITLPDPFRTSQSGKLFLPDSISFWIRLHFSRELHPIFNLSGTTYLPDSSRFLSDPGTDYPTISSGTCSARHGQQDREPSLPDSFVQLYRKPVGSGTLSNLGTRVIQERFVYPLFGNFLFNLASIEPFLKACEV